VSRSRFSHVDSSTKKIHPTTAREGYSDCGFALEIAPNESSPIPGHPDPSIKIGLHCGAPLRGALLPEVRLQ